MEQWKYIEGTNGKYQVSNPSLAEAERQNEGIHHANMIKCCKGLIKSIGGFKWKYAD